jgi:hypothetical protein
MKSKIGPQASVDHQGEEARDEEIGRRREDLARLANAAQVGDGDGGDTEHAQPDAIRNRAGNAEVTAAIPAATLTATVRT